MQPKEPINNLKYVLKAKRDEQKLKAPLKNILLFYIHILISGAYMVAQNMFRTHTGK